ncbi:MULTISPECIES: hypothetical protein [unclassified Rickettsia]
MHGYRNRHCERPKGARQSRKIIVILNLFQDLLQEMLKQVQHDKN